MSLRPMGLLLMTSLVSSLVSAATLSSAVRSGSTRFLSRSLGSACYTMDSVQRGLPCNPAAIAKEHNPRFDVDLFLGTNLQYIKDAEQILRGNDSSETVANFFSHRETVETEASLEASFQAATWGISVEPYRIVALTRFENPALPMVDLVIAEEQNVKAQIASYARDDFYAGVQIRYTHVRYIGRYFALSEAFVGDTSKLFEAQTQELLYLEPGILYSWEELGWQPQVSAVLTNWGVTSSKTDQYPIRPEGLLGASVKPVVPLGLLELGLQFQANSETRNARDAFRVSLAYQIGILQAIFSTSEYDRSAGFLVAFKNFSSGLSYWDQEQSRGVYIQFGASL